MDINEKFKMKFNELDQLCKKMYPECKGSSFTAIRKFANTLDANNKSTLLNLISARNMKTHDKTNIINFDQGAVKFIQGLIDGINRKMHNGLNIRIDSELENLRTKNLKIMSYKINGIISKYSFLDKKYIDNIRNELNIFIEKEKKASNLDLIKKYYFDFLNYCKLIESRPEVKATRQAKREQSLERAKSKAINDIERMYMEIIAETTLFNITKRNKAKHIKESAIMSLNRANSFYEIEDIVDEYEDYFNDLLY